MKPNQPAYRRKALTAFAQRLRRDSFFAETIENELEVEDLCDYALDLIAESTWAGASVLLDAASVLAETAAMAAR